MEDDDQRRFWLPNGDQVNADEVDWSTPGALTNGLRQLTLQLGTTLDNIEQLMSNMSLNSHTNSTFASSSTNTNGAATSQSTPQPNWQTTPSPLNNNTNNDLITTPYYHMQNPSSSSLLAYREPDHDRYRRRYLKELPAAADIVEKVKDQDTCRLVQDYLDCRVPGSARKILAAVRHELAKLAVHHFGNYFVQKLIEVVEHPELVEIVIIFASRIKVLRNLCTDENGNKVILILAERLSGCEELQMVFMESLSKIGLELTKSTNCKMLIDKFFELFAYLPKELLLTEIANHCKAIAEDKSGCCILQKCFAQNNPQVNQRLVNCVTQNAFVLSQDPYGNYIVQFVIELEVPFVAQHMAANMITNFVSLSTNIHSSNVVEKLMKSDENVAELIILEIMANEGSFLRVAQNIYGNFVAQTALKVSESKRLLVYNDLRRVIENYAGQLKNHPHGRNVLRAIKVGQNIARRNYHRH